MAGASKNLLVGNINTPGSYVRFSFGDKAAQSFDICYASMNSGTISIYLNDIHVRDVAFTSTGGWFGEGNFRTINVDLPIYYGQILKIQFDEGDAALNLDYIEIFLSTSATIDPASVTFDKNEPADVTTTIEWYSADQVTDVTAGGVSIGQDNYSVGSTTWENTALLTIKKEYLATLACGNLDLNIKFNRGSTVTLSITIKDPSLCSVTYNANGGSGTAPTEGKKSPGATFLAANNTFDPPTNKKFKEWNTAANGSGTAYAPGATVTMPAHDLILYAIWRDLNPGERIEADFDALVWNAIKGGNSVENDVRTALNLPKTGANGTTIAWSASPPGIINTDTGVVTRQLDNDNTVALKATVSYTGGTAKTKTFQLTIPEIPGRFEAEDADISGVRVFGGAQAVSASGGKQVGDISTAGKSYVQWNNLPQSRTVEIRYASVNTGKVSLYKNGEHFMDVEFNSTGGWFGEGRFGSLWLPLEINSGDSLKIQYDSGDAVLNLDYIECYSSLIEGAVLSPASLKFDKTYPADVAATVQWNDAGSITGVKEGVTAIGAAHYSVSGSTLTIDKDYLATKPTGSLVLTVEFDKGAPATLTVAISTSATLSPTSGTFNKTSSLGGFSTNVTWNSAGSITDVKEGGTSIGKDNYSIINGNVLYIEKDYLLTKATGSLVLTVEFDKGAPAALTIAVSASPKLSPAIRTFDKTYPADVTTTIIWNDATSVTDVKRFETTIGAANYSVSENTLTIKKGYLDTYSTGNTAILLVSFNTGAPVMMQITIIESAVLSPAAIPLTEIGGTGGREHSYDWKEASW